MSNQIEPNIVRLKPHKPTVKRSSIHADPDEYTEVFRSPRSRHGANYLTILCLILGCATCMSNICAVKIWQIGPIILDGGFLLFPITYVVTDVLVEIFYKQYTNRLITWCCAVNVVCFLFLKLTSLLPAAPGADRIDISSALGLSSRIFVASVIAMLISSRVNNYVYDRLRPFTTGKVGLFLRAWVSSFIAHIPDSIIFTTIAFAGRQSTFGGLCQQALTSCLSAFVIETILMPVTVLLQLYLHHKIKNAK